MPNCGTVQKSYFGGELLAMRQSEDWTMSEVRYATVRKCPSHLHPTPFLSLLLRGAYSESSKSEVWLHRPLDVVFHAPQAQHSDEIHVSDTHLFLVEPSSAWMSKWSGGASGRSRRCAEQSPRLATKLYGLFRERVEDPLPLEELVVELFSRASDRSNTTNGCSQYWFKRAVEIVHEEFRQPVNLGYLADETRVHPAHISRTFRRIYGEGISQYTNRLRTTFAISRLRASGDPLAEIALAAGFFDQSHFTKVFKQFTGETPGSYRSRVLNESGE